MKQLLIYISLLFVASTLLVLCKNKDNKPGTTKVEKQEMSFEKLSGIIGYDNAFKIFDSAGKMESNPVAKGSRKPKNNAVVVVWLYDLTLTVSGGNITYTLSPNAEWSGVQRFPAGMSIDGAISIWGCNKYFTTTPPATVTCSDTAPGGESNYRAFTSDHDYTVHISNIVTVTN